MKIMIVTDAWEPQVNGVVRTMKNTRAELEAMGHEVDYLTPLEFRTVPCPTYPDIRLSLAPGRKVFRRLDEFAPDALHLSTEGPLGMAARRWALKHEDAVEHARRFSWRTSTEQFLSYLHPKQRQIEPAPAAAMS